MFRTNTRCSDEFLFIKQKLYIDWFISDVPGFYTHESGCLIVTLIRYGFFFEKFDIFLSMIIKKSQNMNRLDELSHTFNYNQSAFAVNV